MELTAHEQELVAAGEVVGGVFAGIAMLMLIIYIIFIVAWWKIFKKAGFAGWKSLIPIYNQYCLYRISGMSGWWALASFVPSMLLSSAGVDLAAENVTITEAQYSNPLTWLGIATGIVVIVVAIMQLVKLAGAFGKGTGFKIASVFFSPITTLILAFGSAKYDKSALHD